MKRTKWWMGWLAVALLAACASEGSETTPDQSARAAENWVARGYALGQIPAGRGVAGVDELSDTGTGIRLRVVRFKGGGFAVTPTDDRIEPVLAFSENGNTLEPDEGNPLWILLRGDIQARARAACTASDIPTTRREAEDGGRTEAQRKWDELLDEGDGGDKRAAAPRAVSDIRVASFVKSWWGQGAVNKEPCWNYYMPGEPKEETSAEAKSAARGTDPDEEEEENPDHFPCGCTATALAQVMRYYQWPTSPDASRSYQCAVKGVKEETKRRMIEGPYSWSRMPLRPKAVRLSQTEREALGKLTYNIGVSRHVDWGPSSTGGSGANLIGGGKYTLQRDHMYANAVDIVYKEGSANYPWSLAEFKKAVIPNMDARCPVLLSLPKTAAHGGHSVVADGYGYSGNSFWIHVNMGWEGSSDAWYCPPNIWKYTAINGLVCNIFPQKTGNIVSGRVLDPDGKPVAGATVTAEASGAKAAGARAVASAKSDGRGIYALVVPGAGTWTVTATAGEAEASVEAETTEMVPVELASEEGSYYPTKCNIGNTYGNDITLGAIQGKSTVTLDRQGGTGEPDEVEGTFGVALPAIEPPTLQEGYSFGGYWSEKDGMGTQYYDGDGQPAAVWNQLEDGTIFALWNPCEYKITMVTGTRNPIIDVHFGEMPDIPSKTTLVDENGNVVEEDFKVAVPELEGYIFRGYWTGADGAGTQYVSEDGKAIREWDIAGDAALYAKWEGVKCTVTLDAAGGSGGTESVTATYGSVLPAVTPPRKAGRKFTGYYEKEGGAGTQWYGAGGTCTRKWASTEAATLHAHWTDETAGDGKTFAGAVGIAGTGGSSSFSNEGSTKEAGEPTHSSGNYPGGASVWASWTAPHDGDWTFWLEGTSADASAALDTQLAVYTGDSLSELARVAANDDTPAGGVSSRLSFHATGGVEYKIAMDTYRGEAGTLELRWEEGYVHWVVPEYANRFVSRSGGRVEIGVKSSTRWRLVECPDLMVPETREGDSGEAFVFAVPANGTGAQRTATATLQSGDSERASVTIIQHPSMDFATTKEAALERALRENKRVLLVWGRETCGNTRGALFSAIPSAAVKALVDEDYVLWFSNCDVQNDANAYAVWGTLPTVAIIDPQVPASAVAATNGPQSAEGLLAFLGANAGWTGLLAVETETLGAATVGTPYEAALEATGGTPPYAWGVKGGYAETAAAGTFAATGTAQGWRADDACWDLPLPFAFPFFGGSYTNAKINSNGAISFGTGNFKDYSYGQEVFLGSPIVAAMWTDLTTEDGDIFVERGTDAVTVRWAGTYYSGAEANFSATLRRDGTIVLSYGPGNAYGGVIGISAGDGTAHAFAAKSGTGSLENAADIAFAAASSLPEGLALSGKGVLSGTPAAAGTFAFTVVVTDANAVTVSKDLALTVSGGNEGKATASTPVAVPWAWLAGWGLGDGTAESYEAAASAKAANGANTVWQCYVAGLDPTDAGAAFRAELVHEDGKWKAKPAGGELTGRVYRVEAKKKMSDDEDWTDVTEVEDAGAAGWRFYRVGVARAE